MAIPSKSVQVVIPHQAVTHPGTVVGVAQDILEAIQVTVFLDHALVEAVPNSNPASWLIQVSGAVSGDDQWLTEQEILLSQSGTPPDEGLTATEPVGETVLAVVSTTGFTVLRPVYVQDASETSGSGFTLSEWNLVQRIVTDTSLNLLDGLTAEKDSADTIWGTAERIIYSFNVESKVRYRVVYMHEGAAGANTHIRATATVEDSFG